MKEAIYVLILMLIIFLILFMVNTIANGYDLSDLIDYFRKKKLAGRSATQKFKDLDYGQVSNDTYYKFKKVPIEIKHKVDGEVIITKDEKEEVDKRIIFYDSEKIVLMSGKDRKPFPMTLEELDAISTKVIELGWLKNLPLKQVADE